MATATVWENGRVNLNLPNVSIITERREAETLRDQLNAALPEQIEDLLCDPRIKDLHVLQAARVILGDRGQDVESLNVAIDHIERQERGDTADEAFVPGQVLSDHTAPRIRWVSDTWVNGRNATIETKERRLSPAVTERTYTVEAYVLNRHRLPELRHTKRFPNYTDAETAANRWTRMAEWPGATEQPDVYDAPAEVVDDDDNPVAVGDRVRDPMDGRWRTVTRIEGDTVYMADGGCMSADECGDIRLPSEDLD